MAEEDAFVSELKAQIGKEVTITDPFEVEKGMLRRFAVATGDPDPVYHDDEYAKSSKYGEIVAPPTFVFEWNHHSHGVGSGYTPDQSAKDAGPKPRGMRAGNDYEIFEPVRPGDIITTTSAITEVYEKQGRSGHLIFNVMETTFSNQHGTLLARSRDTGVRLE